MKHTGFLVLANRLAQQGANYNCELRTANCELLRSHTLFRFIFCFLLCFLAAHQSIASDPSPQELLQAARLHPTAHPLQLSGELRGKEESVPLTLTIEQGEVRYQLHDPEETIVLKLGPNCSSLSNSASGNTAPLLPEGKRYQEIRNTGIAYDDLSLGFLYWSKPHLLKKESLRGMKVAVIELCAPSSEANSKSSLTQSPYGSARLWVDFNGMPLRMEGFDRQGNLLKRFEIISAQKIEGLWMLKEMRIETFDPKTGKILQRCYLDLSAQKD